MHIWRAGYAIRGIKAKYIVRSFHLVVHSYLLAICLRWAADLTEPIDVYAEYVDAADAAQKEEQTSSSRRANASSSRTARPAPPDEDDD